MNALVDVVAILLSCQRMYCQRTGLSAKCPVTSRIVLVCEF